MFHEVPAQCILAIVYCGGQFMLFRHYSGERKDVFLLYIEKCYATDYRRVEKITTIAVSEDLMNPFKKYFFTMLLAACFLSGCYITACASSCSGYCTCFKWASQPEKTFLSFWATRDDQQVLGKGVEKWLYIQTKTSTAEKTPFLGKYFGTPEVNRVFVTFTNGIVTDSVFSSNDEDELDWADDYSWQKKN